MDASCIPWFPLLVSAESLVPESDRTVGPQSCQGHWKSPRPVLWGQEGPRGTTGLLRGEGELTWPQNPTTSTPGGSALLSSVCPCYRFVENKGSATRINYALRKKPLNKPVLSCPSPQV